jgi:cytochrome P450
MEFTDHFIDEVLRMWPPATGNLARVAKVDLQIGPFSIKKGSLMGSNILGLMQNPKYYEDPEVFDPYRWTKPGEYTKEPYSFIPFSAGPRSCIGKYVAIM